MSNKYAVLKTTYIHKSGNPVKHIEIGEADTVDNGWLIVELDKSTSKLEPGETVYYYVENIELLGISIQQAVDDLNECDDDFWDETGIPF
ncbi:MAG: hypothetical protein KC413_18080 [Anaerolineales bacterium]|nr:hypothetical protein [Anaerolineales bacterium]